VPRPIDITGQRFGRLTAVAPAGSSGREGVLWGCLCDCSASLNVTAKKLRSGNTKSCGCLVRDTTVARNKTASTHGHTVSRRPTATFTTWVNMIQRCTNPEHNSFKDYGGRGIEVCLRWQDFQNFLDDMGVKPSGTQIERNDNNQGYNTENCEWVTPLANSNNRRTSRKLTAHGETKGIKAWAKELGTSHAAIAYRLKTGWTVEEALNTPFVRGSNGRLPDYGIEEARG
jgi:hypothetical protein